MSGTVTSITARREEHAGRAAHALGLRLRQRRSRKTTPDQEGVVRYTITDQKGVRYIVSADLAHIEWFLRARDSLEE